MISRPSSPDTTNAGGIDPKRFDSNQQGVALPYWFGRRWFPITWCVSKPANVKLYKAASGGKSAKNGSSQQSYATCDVAGLVACGPADFIEAIKVSGKIVWAAGGGISRGSEHPEHTGDIVVQDAGAFRLHWGTTTAAGDFLILNNISEEHPFYREQIVLEVRGLRCASSGSLPNVEVLLERAPRFDGVDDNRSREGANGIAALAELIDNSFYGLGRTGLVHVPTAAALAEAIRARTMTVEVPGDPIHTAYVGYLSGYIAERQAFGSFAAAVLENYDGWMRQTGEQLEFGRFPHDGVMPADLPEITLHDLVDDPEFPSPAPDSPEVYTEAIVTGPDRDWDMQDAAPQRHTNDAAVARLKQTRTQTYARPFLCTSYQRKLQAQELANFYANPRQSGRLKVRREKLGALRQGDLFILNYGPSSLRQVFRITKRVDPARGGAVDIDVDAERGLSPLTYVAPADPAPNLPDQPAPVAIATARMLQLPLAFAGTPAPTVVPICSRPSDNVLGYRVDFSVSDDTYDLLATSTAWALRGTLLGALTPSTASVSIAAAGPDIALLAAQTAAAKADDTLLAIVGLEIMSVGDVQAIGGGTYTVALLRGRRGSAAASHAIGDEVFIVPRAELLTLQHASFPRSVATRYFKLPTFTAVDEQELADAKKIAFIFADAGVGSPTSFTALGGAGLISLSGIAPAEADIATLEIWERNAATPAPVDGDAPTFTAALPSGGGSWRYTRSGLGAAERHWYWVRYRDTISEKSAIIGPADATTADAAASTAEASALAAAIAALTQDIAGIITAASDQSAAIVRELLVRATEVAAEASARGAAITQEQTARQTADDSLAQSITTLTAALGGKAASSALTDEQTARVSGDNALAQSITTLTSTVSGHTSSISTLQTGQTTNATNVDALARDLAAMVAMFGDNAAATIRELKVRSDADTSMASSIETLTATVGGVQSTVNVLAAAYIKNGQAVATWGFKLDANRKVVSMQAIAASGGTQAEVGVVIFGGCDVQSDGFVAGANGQGWRWRAGGECEAQLLKLRNPLIVFGATGPSVSPPGQLFATSIALSVAANAGETIRYTANGGTVDAYSSEWPKSGGVYQTLTLYSSCTVRVRAYTAGGVPTAETAETYVLNSTSANKVAAVYLSKDTARGVVGWVSAICATNGATIKYRLQGGGWNTYSSAVQIGPGVLFEAYATKTALTDSEITSYLN